MASIKQLRLRITSLKNTNKITSAMKLVASSKLKKSQDAIRDNKPYSDKLKKLLSIVSNSSEVVDFELMKERPVKKIRYYVYSSDKGLCGSFNNGMIKYAANVIDTRDSSVEYEVYTLGKRVFDFFSKKEQYAFEKNYEEITRNPNFLNINEVAKEATEDFIAGKFDEAYLINNEFESVLVQTPTMKKVLPVVFEEDMSDKSYIETDYIYEPNAQDLVKSLLPKHVAAQFYRSLLENAAGEHGARMTAMENATNNSSDLIKNLTLIMNRARQAAITTELTEIVAGAESQNG
ncbi:MAG: ATP synthase F1 subunit gamma [Fibrobacterales bacterium]